jgi:hypothetical protein
MDDLGRPALPVAIEETWSIDLWSTNSGCLNVCFGVWWGDNAPQFRVEFLNEISYEAIFIRVDQPLWNFFSWITVLPLCRDPTFQDNSRIIWIRKLVCADSIIAVWKFHRVDMYIVICQNEHPLCARFESVSVLFNITWEQFDYEINNWFWDKLCLSESARTWITNWVRNPIVFHTVVANSINTNLNFRYLKQKLHEIRWEKQVHGFSPSIELYFS